MIDKDSTVFPLVVQSAALLDIYCHQPCGGHYKHGDKPRELSQCYGEHYEPHEGHSYAAAANVRKRPRIPMNSNGFCNPL